MAVATWLESHHRRGKASGVAPPTARLDHPGDVHFDPLKVKPRTPQWSEGTEGTLSKNQNQTELNERLHDDFTHFERFMTPWLILWGSIHNALSSDSI